MRKLETDGLYNASLKSQWVDDYLATHKGDSLKGVLIGIMLRFEPYEKECGADICTWTDMDYIQNVFSHVLPSEAMTRKRVLTILKHYVLWCIDHGVPNAVDTITGISHTIDVDNAVRKKLVSGPKQLEAYLNKLFEPEIRPNENCIRRCFLWLAFIGIPVGEATLVSCGDIHFDTMEIWYGGNVYRIYYEAIRTLRTAADATALERTRGAFVSLEPRGPGNLLLRGASTTPPDARCQMLTRAISMKENEAVSSGKTDKRLRYTDIYRSGIFYRMYEDEAAGFPVDFSVVPGLFGAKTEQRRTMTYMMQRHREDYENWKKVYR